MKRLRNLNGGLPLRLQDFDLIQNNIIDAVDCIIQALLPGETGIILKGLSVNVGVYVNAQAGWLYHNGEIFFVPQASFDYDGSKILYLKPAFITEQARTFKDGSIKDVHEIRNYAWGYDLTVPSDAVRFNDLYSLETLLKTKLQASLGMGADLKAFITIPYASGFSPATTLNGIRLLSNSYNVLMLHGAFYAETSYGKIATLPIGQRPSGDVVGFFYNGTATPAVLKIKTNGEIHVANASTNQVNYITFTFNRVFDNDVSYNLPVTDPPLPDN
ncbi:MAG: hypothetical protein HPY80_00195 [Bacteroidales bacterium]|nr:hypothetical protein [Bacteroidales bacterium]